MQRISLDGGFINLTLGQTIARLRKQKNWNQVILAEKLGVHPTHVTRWERGRARPRAKALELLAEIFGVPISDLLDEGDSNTAFLDVDDELTELLGHVSNLADYQKEALKAVLRDMVTISRFDTMLHEGRGASRHSPVAAKQ